MKRDAFAMWLARRLEAESRTVAMEWLGAIKQRLPDSPRRIFPDQSLLDHIPQLISHLAKSLESEKEPTEDAFVRSELRELAELRRSQGYDVEEIVEEFELLSGILFRHTASWSTHYTNPLTAEEVIRVTDRLRIALRSIDRVTHQVFRGRDIQDQEQRSQLLSSFGRAVSHELRNRLNSAMLRVQLASKGDQDALRTLEEAIERVASVVDDVYSVVIARDGQRYEAAARTPLVALTNRVVADLAVFAAEHQVDLRVQDGMPDFPVDATRVQLVLVNLIGNAIKYNRRQDGQAWIEIRAEALAGGAEWRVDVADNGPGIPPALAERIFKPGVRATSSAEGEGLGLALAREAVTQIGGRIWVTSRPSGGSVFSFTLSEPRRDLD